MRPLDKIEKYLKRFASNINESESSRYFTIGNCIVRVSDHFAKGSICYLTIVIPFNDDSRYIISHYTTGKAIIVNYSELKGVVKSINLLAAVSPKSDSNLMDGIIERYENLVKLNSKLSSEVTNLKKVVEESKKFTDLQAKYKQLAAKYSHVQNELGKVINSKKSKSKIDQNTIYGIHEVSIPLSVRQKVHELVDIYK